MKKRILITLLLLLIPVFAFATGTVTQSMTVIEAVPMPDSPLKATQKIVTFVCTGDVSAGTIPDTDTSTSITNSIKGWYLYQVNAYPTDGGTAPDAADVFILDANGMDLLGSEDGGTTAYNGLNLIHATLAKSTFPNMYITRAGTHVNYYPIVTGTLTLSVANQSTASADWTIELIFVPER